MRAKKQDTYWAETNSGWRRLEAAIKRRDAGYPPCCGDNPVLEENGEPLNPVAQAEPLEPHPNSGRAKVLRVFRAAAGLSLPLDDIAQKSGCTVKKARGYIGRLRARDFEIRPTVGVYGAESWELMNGFEPSEYSLERTSGLWKKVCVFLLEEPADRYRIAVYFGVHHSKVNNALRAAMNHGWVFERDKDGRYFVVKQGD